MGKELMPRHLAYTLALDHPPGARGHALMAKMLVLSLLRTGFQGDIVVLKNSSEPLFLMARLGVTEIQIDAGDPGEENYWNHAQAWKFRAHERLDVTGYDKVLYLDADCLALQDPTPLLRGAWDVGFYREPGTTVGMANYNAFFTPAECRKRKEAGVNAGLLAVRASCFHRVMRQWQRIYKGPAARSKYFADQAALNRLIADTKLRTREFTRAQVASPFSHDPLPQHYFAATLVHLAGSCDLEEKLRFLFGLYMNTFFFDPQGFLLHVFET